MWNTAVSNLDFAVRTVPQALLAMVQLHPTTALGIVLLFGLLATMLAAEVADAQATAATVDEAPPIS